MYSSDTESEMEVFTTSFPQHLSSEHDISHSLALATLLISLFTMGFITGYALSLFLLGGFQW